MYEKGAKAAGHIVKKVQSSTQTVITKFTEPNLNPKKNKTVFSSPLSTDDNTQTAKSMRVTQSKSEKK